MMSVGMLWFDNDRGRTLDEKVARAAAHYRQKYRRAAELCHVNPATLGERLAFCVHPGGIQLHTSKTVLPNHFWPGVKEVSDDVRH